MQEHAHVILRCDVENASDTKRNDRVTAFVTVPKRLLESLKSAVVADRQDKSLRSVGRGAEIRSDLIKQDAMLHRDDGHAAIKRYRATYDD